MTKKPESITCGIFYCQDSGCFSVSASNKLSCALTVKCFEIGNKNIPPTVSGKARAGHFRFIGIFIKERTTNLN